jgi:excinuclease ABC subunit A
VVARGTVSELCAERASIIGPHLTGKEALFVRKTANPARMFDKGKISIAISSLHTLRDITADFPLGRLTAVTGVSGAGKTALVLDSLAPAFSATLKRERLPSHVTHFDGGGLKKLVMVNATPIGKNERSTLATYSGVFDAVRSLYAATPFAQELGWNAGHFSYNTEGGVCPDCKGTGRVVIDLQFMPNMELVCPTCRGRRYTDLTLQARWHGKNIADALALTLDEALAFFAGEAAIAPLIQPLVDLGLGYLTLGEATPALSGGEAQRLKLVSEMGKRQGGALFIFDEPTTGLHPRDIATLIRVFDQLISAGGTIIVIEHDLDLIANADYIIDMGPGGGASGGKITAQGDRAAICAAHESRTGKHLKAYIERFQHGERE